MQIATKDVREGKHDGEVVWVCHYLRPDLNKKPLRSIPPTKCLIRPCTKRRYYTESELAVFNKKGEPSATAHSPVDNTGYRSFCGNEVSIFDNEDECKQEWQRQVGVVLREWVARRSVAIEEIDAEIANLKEMMS